MGGCGLGSRLQRHVLVVAGSEFEMSTSREGVPCSGEVGLPSIFVCCQTLFVRSSLLTYLIIFIHIFISLLRCEMCVGEK